MNMPPENWAILQRNLPALKRRAVHLAFELPDYVRAPQAGDLLHETLVNLLVAPRQPPADEKQLMAWALYAMKGTFYKQLSSSKRRKDHEQAVAAYQWNEQLPDGLFDKEHEVAEFIHTLSVTEKAAWDLLVDGFSHTEIGKKLGIAPGTVAALRYRAVNKLRKHLSN